MIHDVLYAWAFHWGWLWMVLGLLGFVVISWISDGSR